MDVHSEVVKVLEQTLNHKPSAGTMFVSGASSWATGGGYQYAYGVFGAADGHCAPGEDAGVGVRSLSAGDKIAVRDQHSDDWRYGIFNQFKAAL